ncbi:hypothetical protein PsorP6_007425 [Peronosclerospora sorghi]|uniref:Uncharacterized protein n=1 Tax=Peronosclerospora sorghi TaxID=230839 RepID=A0ACC0WC75_9STRA|nr:hypothetical protein PsorP6_007425 [Peronosclerospora sorghi]
MAEDGTLKTMALKREKRKRKREGQNIRRANRRVGSLIDFIFRRKKAWDTEVHHEGYLLLHS